MRQILRKARSKKLKAKKRASLRRQRNVDTPSTVYINMEGPSAFSESEEESDGDEENDSDYEFLEQSNQISDDISDEDEDDDDDEDDEDDRLIESNGPIINDHNLTRSRAHSMSDSLSMEFSDILIEAQFDRFLRTGIGGFKDEKSATQVLRQVSVYLSWFETNSSESDANEGYCSTLGVLEKLNYIFTVRPKSLVKFIDNLWFLKAKPMTCTSYVCSITKSVDWLVFDHYDQFKIDRSQIDQMAKLSRKCYKKKNRLRRRDLGDISQMIKDGLWPRQGLKGIQKMVYVHLDWAKSLVFITCYF